MDQVATTIASEVVVPTGRVLCTFIYSMIKDIVKFQSNLDGLKEKMEDLLAVKDGVKIETELAENDGKEVKPLVTKWLDDVQKLEVEVNKIQDVKLSPRSLNCIKRYSISRKVAEKLKDIEELRKAGISHSADGVAFNHPRPKAVEHIPGPTIQDHQTTSSKTLTEIRTKLSDDKVRRLGIWGLGGVGKTTLVRTLNNNLNNISSMESFGIVIWVTVSKDLDMKNVQTRIAKRLNLEVKMEESPEQIAIQLYQRLQKERKFLLILDDVWEKIDLDKLGVPQPEDHKGSKILLTTRSFDVCRHMSTVDDVKVAVLNAEESWQLFSRNAGSVASLEHIKPSAEAIVRECCGLPLALVAMGVAMNKKTKVEQWRHALNELQRPVSCPSHIKKIYTKLKYTYDSLEGKQMKHCFLFCSLFPEDFSIAISELAQCWLAEGLLDEQENYEDSFDGVINLIENLKYSCLLEDGAHEDTVKMHDVIRDVAIWIASSSEDGCKSLIHSGMGLSEISDVELSDNSLKRVSFMNNKIVRLPDRVLQCSNASTLILQGNRDLDMVPEKFLQGFESLKVLNMSGTYINSLPLSLLQLGELRALLLRDCRNLKKLPPLEGFCRLQVLDLSLTCIKELPRGMENLNSLKQLNLSYTRYLKSIQGGIISQLSCLEVLDMTGSVYCFRMKGDVPEYMACFEELKCIERLCVLHINLNRIPNFSNEDLSFINRLRQFHFFIDERTRINVFGHVDALYHILLPRRRGKREVTIKSFNLPSEEVLIGPLFSTANDLRLDHCTGLGDMLEDLVIKSVVCFAGLKSLTIQSCSGGVWQGGCVAQHDLLPNLEELCLRRLNYGKSILEVLGHLGSRFLELKKISVEYCSKMEYLFSCGHFIHALPKLEVLKVQYCDKLGELFIYDSVQNIAPDPVVPSLRILELKCLPELRTLCQDEEIWPHLEQVHVVECNLVGKLPLTDQNAENMKEIKGESQWWNTLKWHADTTQSSLMPYFHPI
ncbi:disease resistance protein At4g27190-like [Corylus avellana]|uniref:disease resistance protein At4g27190-like n=1 Tax=Corylus avellana TaxID=13451 RepID=UPI001E21C639|nr:disease resistance protein At4g27190-like [Corylus avellana]XP_059441575.1 disease resistance protein At4g27190-like [Corylus avellana]